MSGDRNIMKEVKVSYPNFECYSYNEICVRQEIKATDKFNAF